MAQILRQVPTMATGVPKKNANHRTSRGPVVLPAVRIEYPGKRSEADLLSTAPAEMNFAWQGHSGSANRLYFGDNLAVLAALRQDPKVAGRVRLVYIDPPYATETVFHSRDLTHAYEDVLSGPEYLESLRGRLILLRELLANDGSLYLHLDEKKVFHAKLILDEVFGPGQYRNCITRKKCNPKNYTRKTYGNVADYILFYTKSADYVWNRPTEPWTPERAKEYQYVEPQTGRRYMKVPVHAPGVRRGATGQPWRGKMPPPGKHWQYPPRVLDELDARGEIYWSPNGNPRRKVYLDMSDGVGIQDIWMDFRDAHNQNIRITGYPTEKNPDLLRRIVEASSNPGDLVLDCYSGSGTTLAVASELGRAWIGVDNSPEAITATLDRFTHGLRPMGDYVGRRTPGRNGPAVRSLFEGSAPTADDRPVPSSVEPIRDFTLYLEKQAQTAHPKQIAKWLGRLTPAPRTA
ncbi:MAG TPA: site-specific DNA-methyltransferase [Fimbriiglobus sp.]|nr:site-specific DNA-methyltransferase [Fimbriiglobus sp.]